MNVTLRETVSVCTVHPYTMSVQKAIWAIHVPIAGEPMT